ncbi:hypothetical protein PG999_012130 [Apiospora kogelbergensis]|uniref:Uncharacterized protein n=1 Tax=Apiospora kogelbergensis TaxID=1337665 RepID=A0AAW0QJ79_9PEZI
MVQYIHSPWRDRAELLKVRQEFYPSSPSQPPTKAEATADTSSAAAAAPLQLQSSSSTSSEEEQKRHAVWRVSMWMQRGSCPHMVESTSLLTAAILLDLQEVRNGAGSGLYEPVRLAYAAAFSRFVTGLLDGQQEKQQKQSMWSIAKLIGLPATFVELRHQCTHEQLPPLLKLRSAAQKSLVWIWDYYWRHVPDNEARGSQGASAQDACRELILSYLQETDAAKKSSLEKRMKPYDEVLLLQALSEIESSSTDPMMLRRSLQLYMHIVDGGMGSMGEHESSSSVRDMGDVQAELAQTTSQLEAMQQISKEGVNAAALEESPGLTNVWSSYKGTWKAKPIGVA